MSKQPFLPFLDDGEPVTAAPPPSPAPEPREAQPASSTAPARARLIDELARACSAHPLDEKILLAPSLLVGHQLVERLARCAGPVVHLRVETVRTLAHAAVAPSLARDGLKLLSRAQALALIEQACLERLEGDSYFGPLRDRPGFHRAIQNAAEELRTAGLAPSSLPADAFSNPRKARELAAILEGYDAALKRGGWVDLAEVLGLAAAATAATAPHAGRRPLLLVPESLEFSALERRVAEGAGRIETLATDPPEDWTERARGARIFRAAGEENEIRAAFREILASGLPFDAFEILHTDTATYPALGYELAAEHGVPATFSGGIAAAFTHPGQAALAFLRWMGRGFEAEALREALAAGTLTFPKGMAPRVTPEQAARELRRARVGWGRDRHLPALDRLQTEIQFRRSRADDDEEPSARRRRRERRLSVLAAARTFVARAISLSPQELTVEFASLARGARTFVAEFGRVTGDLDGVAAKALATLFSGFEAIGGAPAPLEQSVRRLEDAVLALHVVADRPRPGRVHFAEFKSGGFSGRPRTFVLGLDEKRHPGGEREDPVLSDDERRRINRATDAALPLAPDRSREAESALRACLARLRGEVALGYSGWNLRDLANPGEVFPSPFLLEAFRLQPGNSHADYATLAAALKEGEGYVPAEGRALDETEWWLARIGDRRGPDTEAAVARLHPWLADGRAAEEARRSPSPTPWDGVFASPTPELDPRANGVPMSASKIQALAECPFGYFLAHVLKLAPPDDPVEKSTEWLDAKTSGSLIHRVLRVFLEELAASGRRPAYPDDVPRITAVAEKELAAWCRRLPPRSELAFARQREDVLFACRTFLISEAARAADAEPVDFEVSFGIADEERPDAPEPVEIALSGGRSFKLRGSIDRVDRDARGAYQVWDYKTGSAFFVHEQLGIAAGRQIQPALYALSWESIARQRGEPGSISVASSGYFFPGRKGLGERFAIAYTPEETRRTLDVLFDLLAAGAFPHSPDENSDCWACRELSVFCENRKEAARESRVKLGNATNAALAAWRRLREA